MGAHPQAGAAPAASGERRPPGHPPSTRLFGMQPQRSTEGALWVADALRRGGYKPVRPVQPLPPQPVAPPGPSYTDRATARFTDDNLPVKERSPNRLLEKPDKRNHQMAHLRYALQEFLRAPMDRDARDAVVAELRALQATRGSTFYRWLAMPNGAWSVRIDDVLRQAGQVDPVSPFHGAVVANQSPPRSASRIPLWGSDFVLLCHEMVKYAGDKQYEINILATPFATLDALPGNVLAIFADQTVAAQKEIALDVANMIDAVEEAKRTVFLRNTNPEAPIGTGFPALAQFIEVVANPVLTKAAALEALDAFITFTEKQYPREAWAPDADTRVAAVGYFLLDAFVTSCERNDAPLAVSDQLRTALRRCFDDVARHVDRALTAPGVAQYVGGGVRAIRRVAGAFAPGSNPRELTTDVYIRGGVRALALLEDAVREHAQNTPGDLDCMRIALQAVKHSWFKGYNTNLPFGSFIGDADLFPPPF